MHIAKAETYAIMFINLNKGSSAFSRVSLNYYLACKLAGSATMSMKEFQQDSYLYGSNAVFIEELYGKYLQ
jgi:hypothetical protein